MHPSQLPPVLPPCSTSTQFQALCRTGPPPTEQQTPLTVVISFIKDRELRKSHSLNKNIAHYVDKPMKHSRVKHVQENF